MSGMTEENIKGNTIKNIIKKEYGISDGTLKYEIHCDEKNEHIVITGFTGIASHVTVPSEIDGIAVRIIGRKTFLSRKRLKRIVIPSSVNEVQDWAFAYCDGLEEVIFSSGNVQFGKAVFMECHHLKKIEIEGTKEFAAPLMAAAVCAEAYYLLDAAEAGSDEWTAKWDLRLMTVMNTPDNEGYSKQVLCGEEDYGSTDLEAYKSSSRSKKLRMAYVRLLNPHGLSADNKDRLTEYVLAHTKGCDSEESWEIIHNEHGNDREFYELFAELGCINHDNLSGILSDIGEDYPEMKAFFIRYNDEHQGDRNFFDDLEL
jgi:hypothetical protein